MAKKPRIVLNEECIREILKSEPAETLCRSLAETIQSRVGEGFIVTTAVGQYRVFASVWAETDEAVQKCLDDNVLIKAVHT